MGTRGYSPIGEGTWIPAFAGKTGGEWRDLWELVGIRPSGKGRGFRLSPERRVGSGGVYGNWRVFGHRGRDVDSGFRRKDGWGVAVSMGTGGHTDAGEGTWIPAFAGKTGGEWRCLWELAGIRTPGRGRGFRLLPERRVGSGGVYGNWRAYGRRGGDVDSGFRRKDGVGPSGRRRRGLRLSPERREWWRRLRQPAGLETPEGTWIPAFAGKTELGHREATTWVAAFAGKTGVVAASTATGGPGDTGGDVDSGFRRKDGVGPSGRRRRGLRLSPERREWWRRLRQPAGLETPGGDVDSGESRN